MAALQPPTDLIDVVDWSATEAVNSSSSHTLDNALKQGYREDAALFLESDADEQLILHIHFTSAIRLSAITIAGPDDGHGPRGVKLFVNRSTLGFSEAEDEAGVEELQLEEKHLKGEAIQLRLAKFQGVNTLTVFVASNQGDVDTTQVTKILMSGTTVQGMNVADIKKPDED